MDKKIILPNNWFGGCIMLLLIILTAIVPLVISYWLISMIAPWWVSLPFSLLIEVLVFVSVVKFKQ